MFHEYHFVLFQLVLPGEDNKTHTGESNMLLTQIGYSQRHCLHHGTIKQTKSSKYTTLLSDLRSDKRKL